MLLKGYVLGEQDKIYLVEIIAGALERALAPSIDAITNLSARTGAVESRLAALAQVTESGFRNAVERLDSLDVRVEGIVLSPTGKDG